NRCCLSPCLFHIHPNFGMIHPIGLRSVRSWVLSPLENIDDPVLQKPDVATNRVCPFLVFLPFPSPLVGLTHDGRRSRMGCSGEYGYVSDKYLCLDIPIRN